MLLEPFGLAELAAAGGVAGTLGGRGRQRFRYSISPAGEKQQHSTGCAGSRCRVAYGVHVYQPCTVYLQCWSTAHRITYRASPSVSSTVTKALSLLYSLGLSSVPISFLPALEPMLHLAALGLTKWYRHSEKSWVSR